LRIPNIGSIDRSAVIYFVIVASFLLLITRLFLMQIVQQQAYDEKSADNSIKAIEQVPLRGVFRDRNGEILVSNVPAYTLRILPADYDSSLNRILETVIDVEPGFISKILHNNRIYSKYVPVRIKRGIDFRSVAWLEENSEHLPGVNYIVEMQRGYPAGIIGSHLFGYTKEISPEQLKREKDYYNPGDYVGYNGLEKAYEKDVRGVKGFNYMLVDSKRKEIGKYKDGLEDMPSVKGHDLMLAIDADVQRIAEQEFKGKSGAVVAIEPQTGEILALVSAPDYDLNQFSYVTSKEFLQDLYSNPLRPSFNRATMSVKPPGSTFKLMAAIAGLDLGVITPSTTIYCGGGFTFGRFFKCHGGVHGAINVTRAIEKSCNTFFYNLIYKIGLDRWAKYSERFGFNQVTGIDIGEEVAGLIPNSKYYEKIYGDKWPRSIMASLGIGQGEVSVTPLQLAKYVALIANDGNSFVPHVVKGFVDDRTGILIPTKHKEIRTGINREAFKVVKEGMYLVVQGAGTATRIRMKEFNIAGKTGTAQNPHGKDHAFFIGFAPYENPQIALAVVVENAGFGATWAAPIAQKMFEAYLLKDKIKKEENKLPSDLKPNIVGASFAN
jgi:penicillin-binding protein 2